VPAYKGMGGPPVLLVLLEVAVFVLILTVVGAGVVLGHGPLRIVNGVIFFILLTVVLFMANHDRTWRAEAKASQAWWARYNAATTYEERSALWAEKEAK